MIIRLNILSLVFVAALPGAVYSAGDPAPPETLAISAYEQGREQARSENWDRAAALFQSVVEKDGQDYRALNMLGYSLRQIGRLADSLAAYDRALSIKPDYAPALEYRGVTLLKSGNRRAALADYRVLVRLGSPLAADLKEALDRAAKN